MKPSLLRYSAWISLVFMALVSCRSGIELWGEQAYIIHESLFTGTFEKLTFKTKVIYKEIELSGLMLIKNTGDGNYKIAFYNELGMTYLEGTLGNKSQHKKLVVKNIAPIINNKIFLNNFEKSIQIVLTDKTNPCLHASMPPRPQAPTLPSIADSILMVQLRNGFRLELSPQITQINTE